MPKHRHVKDRKARRARTFPAAQKLRRNSQEPVVSIVIPVVNERRTIGAAIREARRVHAETEVIVVANGTTDGSDRIAEQWGAQVVRFAEPLGHDVGRSVGAKHAKGQVILFLDGDMVIPAGDLTRLTRAVLEGTDVALNRYLGPVEKDTVHRVVLAKHALNTALGRGDLLGASMTTIPHAISRKALMQIGTEVLAVPPMAHTIAIHRGLNVQAVHYIDVGARNPKRRRGPKPDPLAYLIVGDHLEALAWLSGADGARGGLTDLYRNRDYAG